MILTHTYTLEPQIPNVTSPNFSRVFGTNTSAFELLVLKRKIMGPCWLQIKKPHVEHKGVSFFMLSRFSEPSTQLSRFHGASWR